MEFSSNNNRIDPKKKKEFRKLKKIKEIYKKEKEEIKKNSAGVLEFT